MWLTLLALILGANLACPAGTFEIHTIAAENLPAMECRPPDTQGPQFVCTIEADSGIDWVVRNPAYSVPFVVLEYTDGSGEILTYAPFAIFVTTYTNLTSGDYGVYNISTDTPIQRISWCAQNNYRLLMPIMEKN